MMKTKDYEFDPAEQVKLIENFIKTYFAENGNPNTKAVIGISGGKDSTIKSFEIDIGPTCEKLYKNFQDCTFGELMVNPQIRTNTPARIRMATLYMVAAAVGGRVCNTGNASEAFIGYTTKYGDLAGDFAILRYLTVREIYAIGDYLELPILLVHKQPSDGMSGKTDEDNTGIPYDAIDDFLLNGTIPEMAIWEKMQAAHKRNEHKEVIQLPAPQRYGYSLHRMNRHGGIYEVF